MRGGGCRAMARAGVILRQHQLRHVPCAELLILLRLVLLLWRVRVHELRERLGDIVLVLALLLLLLWR